MSKTKRKQYKHKLHWVHFAALGVLGAYFLLSKLNLVHSFSKESLIYTFLQLYIFGSLFACVFLYLFSHERFFPFAKEIEKVEEKEEDKYLKKYIRHGKIIATFIIGAFGGPVFSSLTARLLLKNYAFKYLVVVLANIPSSLFSLGLGHGLIKVLNF